MAKFSEIVAAEKTANDAASTAAEALIVAGAANATAHQAVLDGLAKAGGKVAVVNPPNVDVYSLDTPATSYSVVSVPEDPEV